MAKMVKSATIITEKILNEESKTGIIIKDIDNNLNDVIRTLEKISRYDEKYDFDSWIYGTYKNVGWNQESKISCMDEVFDALEDRGITEYDSFLEYCDAKGVCVEKNGKLVIDTGKFSKVTEEYMNDLNSGEKEVDDTLSNESSGFRI